MVANSIFETLPHPPTSVWTLPTTPTVTPAPNYPENSYRHACGGDEILVQCPGCLISGLYNTALMYKELHTDI